MPALAVPAGAHGRIHVVVVCAGCTGAALPGVQVHHAHVVTHELPVPAGRRYVPSRRRYAPDLVQHEQHGHGRSRVAAH